MVDCIAEYFAQRYNYFLFAIILEKFTDSIPRFWQNSWNQFHDFLKIHGFNSTIFEKFLDYIPKFCIFATIKPHEP
jgi:hypothetical protein